MLVIKVTPRTLRAKFPLACNGFRRGPKLFVNLGFTV